jgi:DNA-binding transcriptional MerR regulator
MNEFTIRDLENLSGIKAHTIRIWEQRYSFLKANRTDTNIRYYTSEQLKTILNIALLNKYGFKVSAIDKMSEAEMQQQVLNLGTPEASHDRLVSALIAAMIDMDAEKFDVALDKFVLSHGIDKTITQIMFPFLDRVGLLWLTGHIIPAQEHLVSNIIRQKLIAGIETSRARATIDKLVLLFLPEGEHHELGLLYVHYLLKNHGVRTLYLGADLPFDDLVTAAKLKKPDFIYMHLTSKPKNFHLDAYLTRFTTNIPRTTFIISGKAAGESKKEYPAVQLKNSLREIMDFIGSL